jgi:hypothetical protein
VWVQLILQYFILIAEILCLKLFVFNKYQLLLEYKMNDTANKRVLMAKSNNNDRKVNSISFATSINFIPGNKE